MDLLADDDAIHGRTWVFRHDGREQDANGTGETRSGSQTVPPRDVEVLPGKRGTVLRGKWSQELRKHVAELLPSMLNSSVASTGRKLLMIDVGANVGQILPFYRSLLKGYDSELFLFEPNPSNFQKPVQLSRHQMDVKAVHSAVSDQEGIAHFDFGFAKHPKNEQGNQHGHLTKVSNGNHTLEVPVNTLDALMEPHLKKGTEVIYLKSDTEGFDYRAMRGAKNVVSHTRIYLFECHKLQRLARSTHRMTSVFLGEQSFDVYKLSPAQLVLFGDEFYNRLVDRKKFMGWQNCVAIHRLDPVHPLLFARLNHLKPCSWDGVHL
uniref:Methyltransferase FkbM domain-containing protein n=1 Tax=Picocystis salinarum TaxID=88271 RepID=A0A6U9Q7W0_9CHLO|mmetsp:Transcript_5262/g.33059  ORF Transcript_5262/g.33059 Transcript_5262/m.33059 type:complete len:321 (+) Transcript_5262:147-1109(+)